MSRPHQATASTRCRRDRRAPWGGSRIPFDGTARKEPLWEEQALEPSSDHAWGLSGSRSWVSPLNFRTDRIGQAGRNPSFLSSAESIPDSRTANSIRSLLTKTTGSALPAVFSRASLFSGTRFRHRRHRPTSLLPFTRVLLPRKPGTPVPELIARGSFPIGSPRNGQAPLASSIRPVLPFFPHTIRPGTAPRTLVPDAALLSSLLSRCPLWGEPSLPAARIARAGGRIDPWPPTQRKHDPL